MESRRLIVVLLASFSGLFLIASVVFFLLWWRDYSLVLFYSGVEQEQLGEDRAADEYYRKASVLSFSEGSLKSRKRRLALAYSYRDYEQAVKHGSTFKNDDFDQASFVQYQRSLWSSGRAEEALALRSSSSALVMDSLLPLEEYEILLFKEDRFEEALAVFYNISLEEGDRFRSVFYGSLLEYTLRDEEYDVETTVERLGSCDECSEFYRIESQELSDFLIENNALQDTPDWFLDYRFARYLEQHDFARLALVVSGKAAEAYQEYPALYALRAELFEEFGDLEQTDLMWKKVRELDPNYGL